jgi:hypothetical protein
MSLFISIALMIGWFLAIVMGIALLTMSYHVGSRYQFTNEGISRMGPSPGKRLGDTSFLYENQKVFLRQYISSERPTLLVFVDPGPLLETLIPDLSTFMSSAVGDLACLVFINRSANDLTRLSFPGSLINVLITDGDNLPKKLGIRVTPYALLVDQHGQLIAKGLINNFTHLCVLIDMAVTMGKVEGLINLSRACQPVIVEMKRHVQVHQ